MGAAPSCRIFETFSTALKRILAEMLGVVSVVKKLDGFLFLGATYSKCNEDLHVFSSLCARLGVPLAPHKTEGPCTTLTFIGFELDVRRMQLKMPEDKQRKYALVVNEARHGTNLSLQDLKGLIGKLQFATAVIPGHRPSYDTYTCSLIERIAPQLPAASAWKPS